MIMNIYRDVFERIYIWSPSINVDHSWLPVKDYIEKHMKIDTKKEKIYHDEYNPDELEEVMQKVEYLGTDSSKVDFDVVLARGLSYYTGAIYEVKVKHVKIGSVSGGGRYDNLTGVFGLEGMSGVGFSFGVDRIYDVMEELELFPESTLSSTEVLLSNFDATSEKYGLGILAKLRAAGIKAELYPDSVKLKKQMMYANKKQIPFVVLIGEEEMQSGLLTLKNMGSGEQIKVAVEEIITTICSITLT